MPRKLAGLFHLIHVLVHLRIVSPRGPSSWRLTGRDLRRTAGQDPPVRKQMTTKGIHQLEELGTNLRGIYSGWIGGIQDIYIRSTNSDRCFASAVALVSGLLPDVSQIQVHSVPKEMDDLVFVTRTCKNQYRHALKIGHESRCPGAEPTQFAYTGIEYLVLSDFDRSAFCNAELDLSKPTPNFNAYYRSLFFDHPDINPALHRLRIGPVLLEIKRNVLDPAPKTKLNFYSAHDMTLSVILSALDIRKTNHPGYASNLLIELWAPIRSDQVAKLRFIYNGVQVHASWCESNQLCSVPAFLNYMDSHLQLHGGFETYKVPTPAPFHLEAECDSSPTPDI